ncbi:MAG: hypothetical protein L0Z46_12385 [Nitrospiraceae bacterium]|nr:hypothetical protein [Nitrospiraceae bacterium]
MEATPVRRHDLLIVISIDFAAGHMPGFGLPEHGIVGPLLRLFPFHFGAKISDREHDFVEGALQRPFTVL